jgi:pSer/pThr/pTyr-binding forkhead associated (FHA) protein
LGKRAVASGAKNAPPMVTPRSAAIGRLVLKAREGEQNGTREYPLDGRDIVIGRAPTCDVVLPSDQLASRRHTLLEFDGVRYTIRDLGSSNGTYVNGEEIHQTIALNDGDMITVGEHDLVFTRTPARTTDGFPIPVPPPWPPAFNGTSGQPASPTQKHSAVSSAQQAVPAGATTGRPAAEAAGLGGQSGDIEQLHKLLMDASAGMLHRAEKAERQVAELRLALDEVERAVGESLSALADEISPFRTAQVDAELAAAAERRVRELEHVARAAAENSRHLDHITVLADRAGDISGALEATANLARALGAMSVRLATLSAEPAGDAD